MKEEKLIKENEKFIWKIASSFYNVDRNDLFQAGVLGLLKAYRKYDKNSPTKFSTYAYDYIFGEMYLLANNRNIKISKDILKLYKKIENTRYILAQKISKIPSNLEMAEYLGLDLDMVNMACSSAREIMSLDSKSDEERDMYEMVGVKTPDIDTKILINDSFEVLNDDEREIIKSRYYEDLTQQEVARKLNMTQVMVSRYEKKGINKMRDYLTL
jgi:RNA polymerase sporulation-specific sigma factor